MHGFAQSLNVSVAAGVALDHLARARRRHLGAAGDLPPERMAELRARFYRLSLTRLTCPCDRWLYDFLMRALAGSPHASIAAGRFRA